MFKKQKVSVAIPAYNEEEGIAGVVEDFKKQRFVDEVVVVDNNSIDKTAEYAKKAGARVVKEKNQGYGYACKRGMREAKGDIVVLTEADGTFEAGDTEKLLSYIQDVEFVVGTRTTNELTDSDANMGLFLRYGNLFVAKLIQFLWYDKVRLTDVGCTYRAIRKKTYDKLEPKLTTGGSDLSPVMLVEALKSKVRIIEIPLHYKKRKGVSKITGKKWKAFKLGLRMILTILKRRVF